MWTCERTWELSLASFSYLIGSSCFVSSSLDHSVSPCRPTTTRGFKCICSMYSSYYKLLVPTGLPSWTLGLFVNFLLSLFCRFFFISVLFGSVCNRLLLSFLSNIKYLCIILYYVAMWWLCRLYRWMSRQNRKPWTDHHQLLLLYYHSFLLHHRMTRRRTCMSATAQKTGILPCQLYVIVTK